ncbi:regulatory helix-turn-helix LysR family protein [Rhizobium sp. ERR 1071]|nr:LysR family transcriptional regulator [Rhizobium sp. ERR1071]TWB13433.1 regulatory helix-turn-helix LysR family protein [Rhizobium sp. ERR1071]
MSRLLFSRFAHYLDEIANHGSIRKAAERLNVSASAINKQLISAEEEFGVALFERLPRGMRLTSAGELLVATGNGIRTFPASNPRSRN